MAPRLRSNGKRGSASGGHSWFGAIMLSAAIIVSAILFWNATSLQSSMQSSTALQDILLSTPCSNRGDTSLAFQQSMGFFDDIAEKEWTEIHQPRARNTVHYKNTANPDMESTHTPFWNFFNQEPAFSCPHVFKVGGLGDGPKWTCDPERLQAVADRRKLADPTSAESKCLVYSIGSNGNYRFEDGLYSMLGNTCEVHVFDMGKFGQNEASMARKNRYFHQWGLKSSYDHEYQEEINNPQVEWYSFQEIKKKLGHEHRTIDIFKIDCEGCEWHTFKDWITQDIRQILIESHEVPFANGKRETEFGPLPQMSVTEYFDAFEKNDFVMFAKEINSPNWNNKLGGRCSEWSYIKMAPEFLGAEHKQKLMNPRVQLRSHRTIAKV